LKDHCHDSVTTEGNMRDLQRLLCELVFEAILRMAHQHVLKPALLGEGSQAVKKKIILK